MIDLDQRLDSASKAIRSQVSRVPVRPAIEIARRHRRFRAVSAVSALAIGALVFASTTILLNGGNNVAGQPGTGESPPYTYTLQLPGWSLVAVWEADDGTGRSHTLFDKGVSSGTPRRIKIDTGSAAIERRDTLQARDIEPVETILLNNDEAAVYLTGDDAQLLASATMVISWTSPTGDPVAFLFEGVDIDEARELLSTLKPLSQEEWQAITASYQPPVTTIVGN